ncbi:DUF1674 domain-containing protein [Sphingorhabdus arenilitoris]|uniref:DUF1674 domain-containing protein n=1 Tax=Sphingorhabdus arenilitoris TaxID=1490041 RepID=A0ABV8RIK1_9SPHN
MADKQLIKRATKRPAYLDLPYPLSKSPPIPKAAEAKAQQAGEKDQRTRYGDWEREGIAWDF